MLNAQSYPNNRIDELMQDHREIVDHLRAGGYLHLSVQVEETFGKTLLIASASYFEVRLTQVILELYRETTQGAEALVEFVRKQAIGRRFAQLFDWGRDARPNRNANSFYRLFGDSFATYMRSKIQENRELDASVQAFIEIGNLRNQMVHENYADFQLNKTVADVYALYEKAIKFVDEFPMAVREFINQQNISNTP